MNSNILIKANATESLEAFVASLSGSLGPAQWEERKSSNYLGERYYRSFILGLELTVALTDDEEFKDFRFWLCFQSEPGCRGDEPFLDGLADCVARKLVQRGCEVVRPFDMGRIGSGGMVYRLNPHFAAKPRERVLTEEI
jgi:hypothetical protein